MLASEGQRYNDKFVCKPLGIGQTRHRRIEANGCGARTRRTGCAAERVEQRLLLELREDHHAPAPAIPAIVVTDPPRWERIVRIVIIVQSDSDLFQIVLTLATPRRFARLLDCRQEQCRPGRQ